MPLPVAQEVWRERSAKVNIELLADVIDSNTKLAARCLTCGRTWDAVPRHLREGRGCRQCTTARSRIQWLPAEGERQCAAYGRRLLGAQDHEMEPLAQGRS